MLGSFQKIVLITAIVILILSLVVIGIILKSNKGQTWPPSVPECPDWWLADGSGNNGVCTNVKDLGICKPQSGKKHLTMNFNTSNFTGSNGDCNKYTWATNCKVSWDGITYGVVDSPCNS